jgi:hypothetical protein
VPESWNGAAITTTVLGAAAVVLARVSRSPGRSVRHAAAVATGALPSRGVLAFLYHPLISDTTAARKYTHNVAMLVVGGAAASVALRPRWAPWARLLSWRRR